MNGIQDSLFTSAITVGLFSVGLVRERGRRTGRPATFFTAFLAIAALRFAFELLAGHPATPLKALWLTLWMVSSLLVAPCLWLATQESVDGRSPALDLMRRWELGAVVLGALFTLPLLATIHWGTTYDNPGHVVSRAGSLVIHTGMLLCIAVFAFQVPVYLGRCRRLLPGLRDQPGRAALATPADQARLYLPLVVVLTSWAIGLLRTLQCATHASAGFIPLFDVTEVGVTIAGMYLMVRSGAAEARLAGPAAPAAAALFLAPPEPKYAKSPLPEAIRHRIRMKLEAAMGPAAIYRDSLLSLRTLGQALKERPHYLSQVINQDLNSSFYEYVNRHRIDEAKRRLQAEPGCNVLEVAVAVGFNSKSTFNAAFRAFTGQTPREFRAGPRAEG